MTYKNIPQQYDIPQHIAGDTWNGISNITIFRNGSALDLTGAYAEIKVKYQLDAPTVINLNTDNGLIIILDPPSNGILDVPPQIIDAPPSVYQWTLKVTLSSGEKDTFVTGVWPIVKYN